MRLGMKADPRKTPDAVGHAALACEDLRKVYRMGEVDVRDRVNQASASGPGDDSNRGHP